ncbi:MULTISPECIES: dihydrofolate reductase [Phyllobacteriaceae]|jgi:dihydrofolate reductase|uniref:Dihydrofolate reductase n=1 Tax=Mesorhizobium hungaricum TaxID=1566387 RepID=A0A1C2DNZ4_9HYPH|nr:MULTISPECIES: dihydrofolate reductase [Mesorhizobium]MBN9233573.1 dihydrofolate reductase [Mesorhizobium sp.]MDQ0328619.1 dihydrofolate reductase [Mesorhizobium sp. YL-MeA3-2017]OCX16494.1 diacylglycerol kinase [Mesorhizobium hungaricum]
MFVSIHVAIAENGVIGREGGLPWRLSTDLKRFKADTLGKPIVMGRKTWDSFPRRPLPDRLNILVTRDAALRADGAEVAHSLEDALTLARIRGRCMAGVDEICVIGGAQIYAQALPLADRLHVTHVLAAIDGDAYFPVIDPQVWRAVSSLDVPAGEKDSHPTRHVVYERRTG